jgi:hypothetical protein
MVLVATIAVVSLVAILAVATLSLSGRLARTSILGFRDARLDAAAAFGLGSVATEWRARSIGLLSIGSTLEFTAPVPGVPAAVTVAVTRISPQVFWAVSVSRADDGSERRESMILRVHIPNADSVLAAESTNTETLGAMQVDSIARSADVSLPPGASWNATDGVVHAKGDLTITGGTARGILIVDGRLSITGPLAYTGVIFARGGIVVSSVEVAVIGLLRASGEPPISGPLVVTSSVPVVQVVLATLLTPVPVAGRRWAEIY